MSAASSMRPARFDVLLVDDQPIVHAGVRRLLEQIPGAVMHGCLRAAEAGEAAGTLRPEVILQDLYMPDGDGLELVARYRADERLAETSVVVLSGEEDAATKADAFARGANDYLVKLPPPQEFVARVLHHAEAARAQRERRAAFRSLERAERDLARRNALLDAANERLARDNRDLVEDVDAQRERLDRIARLSGELARVQDIDILLGRILDEAVALANCRAGVVFLVEDGLLRAAEVKGGSGAGLAGIPLDDTTIAGEVTRGGEAVRRMLSDGARSGRVGMRIGTETILGGAPESALVVPIVRARDRALGCIALVDGIADGAHGRPGFDEDDERLVGHFASLAAVAVERAQLVRSMILRMIAMAELRDPTETAGHVGRVADLSIMLYDLWVARHAAETGTTRARDALRIGALLHDVGKVGISDAILRKPGRLDDAEFAEMRRHTEIGANLFAGLRTDFDESAAEVALCHHERWDGGGYPRGLVAEAIPLFARIVAVADVFDALSSRRAYKEPWSRERIVEFFLAESGRHFDPEIAAILVNHVGEAESIRARRPE